MNGFQTNGELSPTENAVRTALDERKKSGLYRTLTLISSPQKKRVKVGNRKLLLFSSNSYLNLTCDPLIRLKTAAAVLRWGIGSGGSRLTTGTLPLHMKLEQELSRFYETESALLFNTGYTANTGILSSFGNITDVVFCDEVSHASIFDGCAGIRAQTVLYRHNDMKDLEAKIRTTSFRTGIIASDSVFGMGGDIADIPNLVSLGKKYGLLTLIDEAHALGVLGQTGRGSVEFFGSAAKPDLIMGTLSKSLGGEGGYVCGTNLLIDFLRNSARSFIYTTSQPPADIAAALAALKKLKKNPRTVSRLRKNVACFSEALKSHGILCPVESAVIAVPAGSEENAVRASEFLREKGFLIPAIRFPSVPRGQAILRVTLMSSHTRKEIEAAAAAIAEAVRFGSVSGK